MCEPFFESNFTPYYENISENAVVMLLDKMYGIDMPKRIEKLNEEYKELIDAYDACIADRESEDKKEDFIDELSDVYIVLFHIASIMGVTPQVLLTMAYDKITKRVEDPNYKRKHPHEEACCGNCKFFKHETADGDGFCGTYGNLKECGDRACCNYEYRNKGGETE